VTDTSVETTVEAPEPAAPLAVERLEPATPDRPAAAGRRVLTIGGSVLRRLDSFRLEYVYLVVALLWGLTLVVVMPPFGVPDEPAHFFRAWGMAEGQIFPPRDFKENLPQNVWALQAEFPIGNIGDPAPYVGYDAGKISSLLGESISSIRVRQVTAIPSQNPVAYVPQALGVEVARVTGFSPLGSFYLARLFNLLASIVLVFFAIRAAPFGKLMLLLVALFPVTMSEMASTSPDALMIAGAFFFTGLVLNLSERPAVKDKHMVGLLAVGALLITVKPGYFPLVGLIFLLRPGRFASAKRYAAWVGGTVALVVLVAVLAAVLVPKAAAGQAVLGPAQAGADAVAQVKHVLAHPLDFVRVLSRTFSANTIGYGYWMVGLLGWLTINVSEVAVFVMFALIVIFMGGFDDEPLVGGRRRSVLLLTWAATMVSMCVAIYAALSVVGGPTVAGIQGRYFTPMLPLLLLGLYKLRLRRRSVAVIVVLVALAFVAIVTMRAIWFHYY
jgi:uncharacterized membrane protein